jgi:epoxyqueuosine reductase
MIRNIIKNRLVPSQDYIFGFADLRGLLNNKFVNFPFGISIGKKLDDKIIDYLGNGPTIEYFNYYNQINKELADLTKKIHSDLKVNGIDSKSIKPTISIGSKQYEKHLKNLTYDISHKMVATRAGLGWIGKTDLLISKKFGPRLRLVTILLKQDPGINSIPIEKSRCGSCNICVLICPANAANGKLWNTKLHRDEFFNAFKCREKCGELAKSKLNVDEHICGLCIYACPIGKRKTNYNR